jgi:hypothetical protein
MNSSHRKNVAKARLKTTWFDRIRSENEWKYFWWSIDVRERLFRSLNVEFRRWFVLSWDCETSRNRQSSCLVVRNLRRKCKTWWFSRTCLVVSIVSLTQLKSEFERRMSTSEKWFERTRRMNVELRCTKRAYVASNLIKDIESLNNWKRLLRIKRNRALIRSEFDCQRLQKEKFISNQMKFLARKSIDERVLLDEISFADDYQIF